VGLVPDPVDDGSPPLRGVPVGLGRPEEGTDPEGMTVDTTEVDTEVPG